MPAGFAATLVGFWPFGGAGGVASGETGPGLNVPSRVASGRHVACFLRPASDIGTRPFGGSVMKEERSSPLTLATLEPGSTHTAL